MLVPLNLFVAGDGDRGSFQRRRQLVTCFAAGLLACFPTQALAGVSLTGVAVSFGAAASRRGTEGGFGVAADAVVVSRRPPFMV